MLYRRYHAAQKARREAENASWDADMAEVLGTVATPEPVAAKPAPAPAPAPQQQQKHNQQQHPNQRR